MSDSYTDVDWKKRGRRPVWFFVGGPMTDEELANSVMIPLCECALALEDNKDAEYAEELGWFNGIDRCIAIYKLWKAGKLDEHTLVALLWSDAILEEREREKQRESKRGECPACDGWGSMFDLVCIVCGGSGRKKEAE